jgi:transmembrane sensor
MDKQETLLKTEAKKSKLPGAVSFSLLAVVVGLFLGFLIYKFTSGYFESMAMVKIASESKRNREVILPDGSKVWLNTRSEIRYPKTFTPDKREVFFEGEGFFAVVKNEEKPFIIHSPGSRVEVVGTTFNLRVYPTEPDLVLNVVSGEVILFDKEDDKNAIQLKKGEQGIFNFESLKMAKNINEDINYLSWQTGKFFFKDAPLSEVVKKLIPFYQRQILFQNDSIKNCKVSLDINNMTINEVMEEIKRVTSIEYLIKDGKVTISGSDCKKKADQ